MNEPGSTKRWISPRVDALMANVTICGYVVGLLLLAAWLAYNALWMELALELVATVIVTALAAFVLTRKGKRA